MSAPSARLYMAATPIGNLEDLTLRVIRILGEADLVICEDTRRTLALLRHLGLKKDLESCHAHTPQSRIDKLAERIASLGMQAVFVTDGGTPGISDPGAALVRACRSLGVGVLPLPGPSALAAALSISGAPSNNVVFAGFLPLKAGKRRKVLASLLEHHPTVVCYESPWRVRALLADIAAVSPGASILVSREMTKLHEEYIQWVAVGEPPEITQKGECTVVVQAGFSEQDDVLPS